MDFITGLPPSKRDNCVYDAILVIVDRYSKMVLYIPACKTWTAQDFTRVFTDCVVCKHGVPKEIVSDRGSIFTSAFWSEICFQLRIARRLSTAFHPQTDGQTERQNQVLEHYLRIFCCEQQDDWAPMLLIAEFTYNNTVHSSTGTSPFQAYCGKSGNYPEAPEDSRRGGEVPAAHNRMNHLREMREQLEKKIRAAQESQKKHYNAKHHPMRFKPGDMVMLNTRKLKVNRPSRKMSDKFVGPFRVSNAVGSQAYRIQIPPTYHVHDVFHVSLLEPYRHREGQPLDNAAKPDVLPDGDEVWEVESIQKKKKVKGDTLYLVKWESYDTSWNQWVPEEDFENMQESIGEFEARTKRGKRAKKT